MDQKKENNPIHFEKNNITLLDLIVVFLKWKKQILFSTLLVLIISIILYFFVFDLIYLSTASIKSTGKTGSILGSIGDNLPDIGGLDDIGLGSSKSAKELAGYEEILNSRRCLEPLIQKFDLMNRNENRFMEDAVKDFRDNSLVLREEKLPGILYVGVYDKDPKLAKEMVEFLIKQLDKINIEVSVQNAKTNREFIEKRYYQAREDLTKSEDSLKSFQVIYGISPDLQVKAAAQTEFTIEGELKAEEVKLDVLKKILSPDQVEVKTQEAKINSIKEQITKIQTSTDLNDFLRLGNSPQIVMSFLRLQREVEIQSKILSFLLPVYEQAKIEEKKETPTVLILDNPYIAEKKAKPKRLTMVLAYTLIGFILSTTLFFGLEKLRLYRSKILGKTT